MKLKLSNFWSFLSKYFTEFYLNLANGWFCLKTRLSSSKVYEIIMWLTIYSLISIGIGTLDTCCSVIANCIGVGRLCFPNLTYRWDLTGEKSIVKFNIKYIKIVFERRKIIYFISEFNQNFNNKVYFYFLVTTQLVARPEKILTCNLKKICGTQCCFGYVDMSIRYAHISGQRIIIIIFFLQRLTRPYHNLLVIK